MSHPPTQARIDLDRLAHNLKTIRAAISSSVRVMAVVKADCYGHSDALCVPVLRREGIDTFAVASLEEGARLRHLAGGDVRIVVLRPPLPGQYRMYAEHDLEAMISNSESATDLDATAAALGRIVPVHLYVDTGMVRNGAEPAEAVEMLRTIAALPALRLQGIGSHFATSDELESGFVAEQTALFRSVVERAAHAGFHPGDIHLANSGGILNYPAAHFSMVRPGISLYGYHPTEALQERSGLLPVMSLRTEIAGIRTIGEGLSISYGRTHYTRSRTTVATLPIGYADGLSRLLSNRYSVLIAGKRYRGVGTICMDEVMIDLDGDRAEVGQEVILLGESGEEKIDAWELSNIVGTIPYEICTGIGARVPRVGTGAAANSR